jgi:methionine-rich copper-binding protein CopC
MKALSASFVLLALLLTSPAFGADTTLDFDSWGLSDTDIVHNYSMDGFTWNGFAYGIGIGAGSSNELFFNTLTGPSNHSWGVIWNGADTFNFVSVDMKEFPGGSATVTLEGYNDGSIVYGPTAVDTTGAFQTFSLNWNGIDELRISPGYEHDFDNFVYNTDPPNSAPSIGGITASTTINDTTTATPFSTVTIADADGDNLSTTVTLDSSAKGVLTNLGSFSDGGGGVYNLASSAPAVVQTAIRALTFNPADNRGAGGSTEDTTFTISIDDGTADPVSDATTVVTSISINDPPSLGGSFTTAGTVDDDTTTTPFSGVTLVDAESDNLSVTLTLTAANGTLSGTGITGSNGSYSVASAAIATAQANLRAAVFTPTANQVAPENTVDTTFSLTPNDGSADGATDETTLITATSINDAPTDIRLGANSIDQSTTGSGADIGTLTSVDVDHASFTYSLENSGASCDGTNGADNASFQINGATLETAGTTAAGSYQVCLQTADGSAATYQKAFTVSVNDDDNPAVVISGAEADPTNSSPFSVSITFDEDVSGFTVGDLTVGNGSAGNLVNSVAGTIWTADITPDADGTVTVDLNAAVATDAAGNGNDAAVQYSVTYDGNNPAVVIGSSESDPTNSSPFSVSITFDEDVSGFTVGDLTVGNGRAGNLVNKVTGTIWTADITPDADGTVTVDLNAAVATDAAGNGNAAAVRYSVTYDGSAPLPDILTPADNSVGAGTASNLQIEFNENVYARNGYISLFKKSGDILVESFDVTGDIYGNGSTTISIDPSAEFESLTDYYVQIDASAFDDASGNSFSGIRNKTGWNFQSADIDLPTVAAINPADNATAVAADTDLSITFSENIFANYGNIVIYRSSDDAVFEVIDVTSAKFGISSNMVTINPAGSLASETAYYVQIDNTALEDASGNAYGGISNNTAWNFSAADSINPNVEISSSDADPVNNSPFAITITFDEVVSGFTIDDISVGNGSADNLLNTWVNRIWTAEITPTAEGAITVDINAAVATDAAGNGNNAAPQFTKNHISDLPPLLTLSMLDDGSVTNNATLNISGTASDDIGINSLTVNGTDVAVNSDDGFSTALTLSEGLNPITIILTDSNDQTDSQTRSITLDSSAPALTIGNPVDNSRTDTASLSVSGSTEAAASVEVELNSDSPLLANVSGTDYSLTITLREGANSIDVTNSDAVGNTNSLHRSIILDTEAPTVSITSPAADISVDTTTLLLQGIASDALGAVTVGVDFEGETFSPMVGEDGSFSQSLTFGTEKTYQIIIRASDELGHQTQVQRNIIYEQGLEFGDINGDEQVDIADALLALQIAVGHIEQTDAHLQFGDVAPLVGGTPQPDGRINSGDALVILKKIVGLEDF